MRTLKICCDWLKDVKFSCVEILEFDDEQHFTENFYEFRKWLWRKYDSQKKLYQRKNRSFQNSNEFRNNFKVIVIWFLWSEFLHNFLIKGRSQTTLTRFWLFFWPPNSLCWHFLPLWTLTKSGPFWTTYLPRLANVVNLCTTPYVKASFLRSLK